MMPRKKVKSKNDRSMPMVHPNAAAIDAWIAGWNAKPTPFKWSAEAKTILEKNARARAVLEQPSAGTK